MSTETISAEDYNTLRSADSTRQPKYRNVKTKVDGITFDSKAEAARYGELKLMEVAGEIANLELQRRFRIEVNGVNVCTYVADFCYHRVTASVCWPFVVEDVKGVRTPAYRLKKKLMRAVYGIEVEEIR